MIILLWSETLFKEIAIILVSRFLFHNEFQWFHISLFMYLTSYIFIFFFFQIAIIQVLLKFLLFLRWFSYFEVDWSRHGFDCSDWLTYHFFVLASLIIVDGQDRSQSLCGLVINCSWVIHRLVFHWFLQYRIFDKQTWTNQLHWCDRGFRCFIVPQNRFIMSSFVDSFNINHPYWIIIFINWIEFWQRLIPLLALRLRSFHESILIHVQILFFIKKSLIRFLCSFPPWRNRLSSFIEFILRYVLNWFW